MLERFDTYKVLKSELTLDYVLFLEYMIDAIETQKLRTIDLGTEEDYYLVSVPAFTEAFDDVKCSKDNMMRKVKVLDEKGFIGIKFGKFSDPFIGYVRTAVSIKPKAYELMR